MSRQNSYTVTLDRSTVLAIRSQLRSAAASGEAGPDKGKRWNRYADFIAQTLGTQSDDALELGRAQTLARIFLESSGRTVA